MIVETNDGSSTLYSAQFNEHYHSIHGAQQESLHVFIKNGIQYIPKKKELNILEFGFGSGLNCLLTILETKQTALYYHSIEAYPINKQTVKEFYDHLQPNYKDTYMTLMESSWNIPVNLNENTTIFKEKNYFHKSSFQPTFDCIYFDAFSPRKQPECWTKTIFTICNNALQENGILVTYCAKGTVKRTLKECGFFVETCKGPPGKREMIRAKKQKI